MSELVNSAADVTALKKVVTRQIAPELIKTRSGGGNVKLSYVSGAAVIDMVNEAANYLKSWEIIKTWKEPSDPTNYQGKESTQPSVIHCHGRLTVMVPDGNGGYIKLVSDGMGSQTISGGASVQEYAFKSAAKDAFKVAASYFGIGLELYRDDIEQAIFESLHIDSPWTEEATNSHAADLNFISAAQEQYGWDQEQLNSLVSDFSGGSITTADCIVPDNITAFVEWLKQGLEPTKESVS